MCYKNRRFDVTWCVLETSPNKRNTQSDIAKWEGRYEIPGAKNPGWRGGFVSTARHFTVKFCWLTGDYSGLFSNAVEGQVSKSSDTPWKLHRKMHKKCPL